MNVLKPNFGDLSPEGSRPHSLNFVACAPLAVLQRLSQAGKLERTSLLYWAEPSEVIHLFFGVCRWDFQQGNNTPLL